MRNKKKSIAVSLTLLGIGIALIVAGILRGEVLTVLEKAIRICVECMGLG